tara:strand:- start:5504 stop:7006 length:1503 start_codon:yes stop_codon:yes gene_type:complete
MRINVGYNRQHTLVLRLIAPVNTQNTQLLVNTCETVNKGDTLVLHNANGRKERVIVSKISVRNNCAHVLSRGPQPQSYATGSLVTCIKIAGIARVIDMKYTTEFHDVMKSLNTAPSGVWQLLDANNAVIRRMFYDPDICTVKTTRLSKRGRHHANVPIEISDGELQQYLNLTASCNGNAIVNMTDLNMPDILAQQLCYVSILTKTKDAGVTAAQVQHNRHVFAKERLHATALIREWLLQFKHHPLEEIIWRATIGHGPWKKVTGVEITPYYYLDCNVLDAINSQWVIAAMLSTKLQWGTQNKFGHSVYPRCWIGRLRTGNSALCIADSVDDCIAIAINMFLHPTCLNQLAASAELINVQPTRRQQPQHVRRPPCMQLTNPNVYPAGTTLTNAKRMQLATVASYVYHQTGKYMYSERMLQMMHPKYKAESIKSFAAALRHDRVSSKRLTPHACVKIQNNYMASHMKCPYTSVQRCLDKLNIVLPVSKHTAVIHPGIIAIAD